MMQFGLLHRCDIRDPVRYNQIQSWYFFRFVTVFLLIELASLSGITISVVEGSLH